MTRDAGKSSGKRGISEREWKRRKGYELLRKGARKTGIARTLEVSWNTVGRWERRLKNGGSGSWKDVKPPGKPSKLSGKHRRVDENTCEGRTGKRLSHRPLDAQGGDGGDQAGVWCRIQYHACLECVAGPWFLFLGPAACREGEERCFCQ